MRLEIVAQIIQKTIRTFEYVPADAKLVFGISPREIGENCRALRPFEMMLDKEAGFEKKFGLKISDVANVEFVRTRILKPRNEPPFDRLIVQAQSPHDWKKTIQFST